MAQPFILSVSNDLTSLNFLGTEITATYSFRVEDAGFNIGLPQKSFDVIQDRPGFFTPTSIMKTFREAELRFTVYGTTRGNVISGINQINKVITQMEQRGHFNSGYRGELAYSWEGATNITYFDVFRMDLILPDETLSLEGIHALSPTGKYMLPGCRLRLYLGVDGYAASLRNYTYPYNATSISMTSTLTPSPTVNGVRIGNPSTSNYNKILIPEASIVGDTPVLTIIQAAPVTSADTWATWFIGHSQGADTSQYEDLANAYDGTGDGQDITDGMSTYFRITPNVAPFVYNFAWDKLFTKVGTFLVFLAAHTTLDVRAQYAIAIDDNGTKNPGGPTGLKYIGKYVQSIAQQGGDLPSAIPLGTISLPFSGDLTFNASGLPAGEIFLGQRLGFSMMVSEVNIPHNLEYLYYMPIDSGLRVWKNRLISPTIGTTYWFVDDGVRGNTYIRTSSTNDIIPRIYSLLNPIKLIPGRDNRLSFMTIDYTSDISQEWAKRWDVKIYTIPTYSVLAL